jgi:hypothetical protein
MAYSRLSVVILARLNICAEVYPDNIPPQIERPATPTGLIQNQIQKVIDDGTSC